MLEEEGGGQGAEEGVNIVTFSLIPPWGPGLVV